MFLSFIFHSLVEVMFPSDSAACRIFGAALPQSLEESSKPAASAVGGPFPHTPVVRAVVAGIGCLVAAKAADMIEARATPVSQRDAARPLALH